MRYRTVESFGIFGIFGILYLGVLVNVDGGSLKRVIFCNGTAEGNVGHIRTGQ